MGVFRIFVCNRPGPGHFRAPCRGSPLYAGLRGGNFNVSLDPGELNLIENGNYSYKMSHLPGGRGL